MRVLVAGASGFVGRRLCSELVDRGHELRAMTRHPDTYKGAGMPVRGDVHRPDTLTSAFEGCDAAYYLVHSLDSKDFERLDAEAARAFAEAAAKAGVRRIVYLGGLGRDGDELSAHLRSRREVERLLASTGVPVTTLRAGIVIGHGGVSWEITRQLVEHLPVMITPRWVRTLTQPIALADVVRYLVDVLDMREAEGCTFEIGGPDVMPYAGMLRRVAAIVERPLVIAPVPMLSPQLSSLWLALVTDVDARTGRSLVDSMTNEVIVEDGSIRRLVPFEPTAFDDAVRDALAEREAENQGSPLTWRRKLVAAGTRVAARMPKPLLHGAPFERDESAAVRARRRRVVAAVSVIGAGLLGRSMSARPGSRRFIATTLAVAATWTAGGVLSGPLHLGWIQHRDEQLRRPVLAPVATGAGAFGFFYCCALAVRGLPLLDNALVRVLRFVDEGSAPMVALTACANGVAEEVFFRGALYSAIDQRHAVTTSTAIYTLATIPTRNPALVVAASLMGTLFGLQRRASGGIQAPALTHVTWSLLMLRYLPPLFRQRSERAGIEKLAAAVPR